MDERIMTDGEEFSRRYQALLQNIHVFTKEWLDSLTETAKDDTPLGIFRRLLPTVCQIFESRYSFIAQYQSDKELVAFLYDAEKNSYKDKKWPCHGALDEIRNYGKAGEEKRSPFNDSNKERIGDTLWDAGIRNLLADRISLLPDLYVLGVGKETSGPDEYDSYHELTLQQIIGLLDVGMRSMRSAAIQQLEHRLKLSRRSGSRGAIHDAVLEFFQSLYRLIELVRPTEMVVKGDDDRNLADYIDTAISIFKHPPTEGGVKSYELDDLLEIFPEQGNVIMLPRVGGGNLEIKVADECTQTRLALARAYLWLADKLTDQKKKKDYLEVSEKLINEVASSKVEDADTTIQHSSLRTLWLSVYLKSDDEIATPSARIASTIQDINSVYDQIREPTIQAIRRSLTKSNPNTSYTNIDSEWLCLWFGVQLLEDNSMRAFHRDARGGVRDILRYFQALGIYMLHQIHSLQYPEPDRRISFTDAKGSPDSKTIEAKTFLISQFAHTSVGVDRQIRLYSHLQELFSPELLLYVTSESHRDHLFHVIDVCLLGYLLLKCNEKSHWLVRRPSDCRRKQCERNWFVASLLHDVGYRLKLSEKMADVLAPLKSPELESYKKALADGLSNASKGFNSLIKEKKKEHASVKDCDLEESFAEDHGVVSWAHVRHLLESMKRDKTFVEGMDEALCAIFKHSSPNFKIDAGREPITFLLLLCDKLQEWGRPRVRIDDLTRTITAAMHYSKTAKLDLRRSVNHLRINATLNDDC